jgi:hypothetical protein
MPSLGERPMEKDVPDHISTRIISQREITVDGVPFEWWAVGEDSALVTVRSPMLGSLTELTTGDVAELAVALARKLIAKHRRHANAKKPVRPKAQGVSVLEKPGWFEPGNTDFTSTVF